MYNLDQVIVALLLGLILGMSICMLVKLAITYRIDTKMKSTLKAKEASRGIQLTTAFSSLKQGMSLVDVQQLMGDYNDIRIFVRENGEIKKEVIWNWGEWPTPIHRISVEFINDELRTMSKL